jgi:acyl dehydratase
VSAEELELRRTLTQADFDRFAALSGDDNPIHVDPDFAARTRFGRTVSHGILLVSILRGLAATLAEGARLARHEVRFPAPTFAGEPMVFAVRRDGEAIAFACTREADGVVTCDGRFLFTGAGA